MRRIRLALVGLGHIAKAHLQAINVCNADIELVALCDPDQQKTAQAGKDYNTHAYNDLQTMLQQEKPEIVALCTPNGLHARQGIIAAQYGCHVLTEKPLATTLEDGEALIHSCKEHQVQLMVMMQLRLLPAIEMLKRYIDEGALGRVYLVQSNLFWNRSPQFYKEAAWRGSRLEDGGMLLTQGIHYLDLMQWLLGNVDSTQAALATLARDIETEDSGIVLLKWPSGTIGSLNATLLTYPKNMETSFTILAEKGSVRLNGGLNNFAHWEVENIPQPSIPETFHAHTAYYQHVVQVLRGEAKPLIDGEEGMRSVRMVMDIYSTANLQKQYPA